MTFENKIRVGTRGSLLATTQTAWAVNVLRAAHPTVEFETTIIHTTGDMQRDVPFASVGTKGMFVKEIEQALLDNSVDIGIHSLKDMPGILPDGLILGCIPPRENPYDAFVSDRFNTLDDLPEGAIVGTSSARRSSQIRAYRPDLKIQELRGNLDTRLRKLSEAEYDAIIVASAGLNRLGLSNRITSRIPATVCLPAVGQGALAIEARSGDSRTGDLLSAIHCSNTAVCVEAERAFLAAMGGGCSVPLAAFAELLEDNETVELHALVSSLDGRTVLKTLVRESRSNSERCGVQAAKNLIELGATEILASA